MVQKLLHKAHNDLFLQDLTGYTDVAQILSDLLVISINGFGIPIIIFMPNQKQLKSELNFMHTTLAHSSPSFDLTTNQTLLTELTLTTIIDCNFITSRLV